jgi:hypothetical protein
MPLFALSTAFLLWHIGMKRGILPTSVLFFTLYFAFFGNEALYSGYMDRPAALFSAIGLILLFEAASRPAGRARIRLLLPSLLMLSLAIITKPHAIFAAFCVCSFVAFEFFARRLSLRRAAAFVLLFLAPALTFALIYLDVQPQLWGNFGHLSSFSEQRAGDSLRLGAAISLVRGEMPDFAWVLTGIGVALNALFWRDRRTWISALILLTSVPGFFLYAECCTYDARNAVWILAHAIVASFFGWALLAEWLSGRGYVWPAFTVFGVREVADAGASVRSQHVAAVAAVGFLVAAAFAVNGRSYESILAAQVEQQRWWIAPRFQALIAAHEVSVADAQFVFTPTQPVRYHPEVGALRYVWCGSASLSCFEGASSGDLYFTAPWFENEASFSVLNALIEDGSLVLIGEHQGGMLYRFREEAQSAAQETLE